MSDGKAVSRASALVAPALGLLVLALGAFIGVARYTELLDSSSRPLPTDALHHEPKPCLRYPSAPAADSVATAADALVRAGVDSDLLGDLVGDLYARAAAREAGLHALSQVDEHLEALSGVGLGERLVFAVKRDVLRARLTAIFGPMPAVRATIASLPAPPREVIDAQWARDPSVFVLPGLMDLVNELKPRVTRQRLDAVAELLLAQVSAGKEPDLKALPLAPELLRDAWDAEFTIERDDQGQLTLTSLGADRVFGGAGLDADLTRALGAAPPTTPPPAPVECSGKTAVTLARSDLDAALVNMAGVAQEARVIPAMSEGVVSGFRLTRLRAGLLSRAGLCEGDVVNTVNGVSLASPETALEVYSRLKDATRIELALTREGKPLTLVVQLQ